MCAFPDGFNEVTGLANGNKAHLGGFLKREMESAGAASGMPRRWSGSGDLSSVRGCIMSK
jgi:hypothetical protein